MADQGTAARLIEVATAELGTIEGPKDNETKYGAFTKANFQPWCGSFVMWCANEAGVKVPNTVYTPGGAQAFKKSGAWIDGDLADPEQEILPILISHQMASIEFLTLELLSKITKTELFGVSKETLAQIKKEVKEMADKFQRSFVHLKRINKAK